MSDPKITNDVSKEDLLLESDDQDITKLSEEDAWFDKVVEDSHLDFLNSDISSNQDLLSA